MKIKTQKIIKEQTVDQINGYLEVMTKGFGFLRDINNNFQPGPGDIFVPANVIKKYNLKEGAYIEGERQAEDSGKENNRIEKIINVNQIPLDQISKIETFKRQVSVNPTERLTMTIGKNDRLGKALDLIVPIGKGQRGLIVSPPKAGKTTILKHIAHAITRNHPDVEVYILLVDERPEEVTDFRRSVEKAKVVASSADESVESHLRITRLAMNSAMGIAEFGKDVVVLVDSLTRMSRAFNNATNSFSKTLTGGLGANALDLPRRFFGAARNIETGGSLTILATILVDTGSRMDDIIFQEFKGTGNMDLVLSKLCAEQRIWPAININQSGTRKDDLLLSDEEFRYTTKIRRILTPVDEVSAMTGLLNIIDKDMNLE
ncbi:MAG: transcription termination factor Rho [Calditrichaceae bacterium]